MLYTPSSQSVFSINSSCFLEWRALFMCMCMQSLQWLQCQSLCFWVTSKRASLYTRIRSVCTQLWSQTSIQSASLVSRWGQTQGWTLEMGCVTSMGLWISQWKVVREQEAPGLLYLIPLDSKGYIYVCVWVQVWKPAAREGLWPSRWHGQMLPSGNPGIQGQHWMSKHNKFVSVPTMILVSQRREWDEAAGDVCACASAACV